jgi:hypothetical protein
MLSVCVCCLCAVCVLCVPSPSCPLGRVAALGAAGGSHTALHPRGAADAGSHPQLQALHRDRELARRKPAAARHLRGGAGGERHCSGGARPTAGPHHPAAVLSAAQQRRVLADGATNRRSRPGMSTLGAQWPPGGGGSGKAPVDGYRVPRVVRGARVCGPPQASDEGGSLRPKRHARTLGGFGGRGGGGSGRHPRPATASPPWTRLRPPCRPSRRLRRPCLFQRPWPCLFRTYPCPRGPAVLQRP